MRDRALEPLRRRRLVAINAYYAERLAKGFPTADFPGQPEPERLQCRNEHDRTNWLGLMVKCQEAQRIADKLARPEIMQGVATVLRCSSNRMYEVTFADAKSRMLSLLNAADLAQRNFWRLKDAALQAEARGELAATDPEEGWP